MPLTDSLTNPLPAEYVLVYIIDNPILHLFIILISFTFKIYLLTAIVSRVIGGIKTLKQDGIAVYNPPFKTAPIPITFASGSAVDTRDGLKASDHTQFLQETPKERLERLKRLELESRIEIDRTIKKGSDTIKKPLNRKKIICKGQKIK